LQVVVPVETVVAVEQAQVAALVVTGNLLRKDLPSVLLTQSRLEQVVRQEVMNTELEQKVLILFLQPQHLLAAVTAGLMVVLAVLLVVLAVLVAVAQEILERVVLVIHQALLQAKEIMVAKVLKRHITQQGAVVAHLKQVQTQLVLPLVKVAMELHPQ